MLAATLRPSSQVSTLTGILATRLTPDWCNALQEEIANAIEAAGLTLSSGDNSQLAQAMGQRIAQAAFSIPALPDHDGAIASSSEIAIAVGGEHRRASVAELFAGYDTSSFARTSSGARIEAFDMYDGDLNAINLQPGIVVTECRDSCTNQPPGLSGNFFLLQMADNGGNDIRAQFVISMQGDSFYQRVKWGQGLPGTWRAWKKVNTEAAAYDIPFLAGWTAEMTAEPLTARLYGTVIVPRPVRITGLIGHIEDPSSGDDVGVSITRNGSALISGAIFPRGTTALSAYSIVPAQADLAAGDVINFSLNKVGSSSPGQRLRLSLIGEQL
jgi:hypothetical protein